jgi:hypothetical protein
MSAVTTTPVAVTTIEGSRSPTSDPPVTASITRASNGTSHGWSAYPHARCLPAARKYNSSPK